jgi:hypothetical protein
VFAATPWIAVLSGVRTLVRIEEAGTLAADHYVDVYVITQETDYAILETAAHSVGRTLKVETFDLTARSCARLEDFDRYGVDSGLDRRVSDVESRS